MKWIVALVICFGEVCQPGWIPTDTFATKSDCKMYAELYVKQAQQVYPESNGQLFCVLEDGLEQARTNAAKEGLTLKPAPTLKTLTEYVEKHPPSPGIPQ